MKLFVALTKTVSFTFNIFFITVIIIIINFILTLIFSYIILHLNFECHHLNFECLRQYRRNRTIYTSNRLAHILAKVVFPCTRTLVVAHLLVGQLRSIISTRNSGAGLRMDECGRVLLEPPSSHTALGFPSNL